VLREQTQEVHHGLTYCQGGAASGPAFAAMMANWVAPSLPPHLQVETRPQIPRGGVVAAEDGQSVFGDLVKALTALMPPSVSGVGFLPTLQNACSSAR